MSDQNEQCEEPHYVGEENTLFYIDCGIDVSQATLAEVLLERPDGTIVQKPATATVYNGSTDWVFIRIAATDFNQAGCYKGQARAFIGAWSGWGEVFDIQVDAPISSSSSCSSSRSSSSSCRSSSSSSCSSSCSSSSRSSSCSSSSSSRSSSCSSSSSSSAT